MLKGVKHPKSESTVFIYVNPLMFVIKRIHSFTNHQETIANERLCVYNTNHFNTNTYNCQLINELYSYKHQKTFQSLGYFLTRNLSLESDVILFVYILFVNRCSRIYYLLTVLLRQRPRSNSLFYNNHE